MQQFLAALDGKAGNDQVAAAQQCLADLLFQRSAPLDHRRIRAIAIAIGAFADDVVVALRGVRGLVEDLLIRPKITGEQQPQRPGTAIVDRQLDRRRAQDMTGVPKPGPDTWPRLKPALQLVRGGVIQRRFGIFAGIDRFDRLFTLPLEPAIEPLDFGFLDVAAIGQHEA